MEQSDSWERHRAKKMIYVYEIQTLVVRSAVMDERPYISMIRYDKNNRAYFLKLSERVYIDKLEEVCVI